MDSQKNMAMSGSKVQFLNQSGGYEMPTDVLSSQNQPKHSKAIYGLVPICGQNLSS